MKKIYSFILLGCILLLSACSSNKDDGKTLYLLNWGDYINPELITKFEKENDVKVVSTDVDSNEAMYEQIKNNRTSFDIAIPSDYMIDQLDKEALLNEIDFTKLTNYKRDLISPLALNTGIKENSFIPYFNGTLGIMYNTTNIKNIKDIVETNGFKVLFDHSLLKDAKIGMYNSSRDAFASALLYHNLDINTTNPSDLEKASKSLTDMNYAIYGDDNLKKSIVMGNIDVALVYSGDYYEELIIAKTENKDITFDYYAPSSNNYWMDGLVIPKTSKNTDLAYKFIDFMIKEENALVNAKYIGFASPYLNVINELNKDQDYAYLTSNPYYEPSKIKDIKSQTFKFLGLDYMANLEELFTKTKNK